MGKITILAFPQMILGVTMSRTNLLRRAVPLIASIVLAASLAPAAWATPPLQAMQPLRSGEPEGTIFETDDPVSLSELIAALPAYEQAWDLPYYYQQLGSTERALYLKMKYEVDRDGKISFTDIGENTPEQMNGLVDKAFWTLKEDIGWWLVYSGNYGSSWSDDGDYSIELFSNQSHGFKLSKDRAALEALVSACNQGQNRFEQLLIYAYFLVEHVDYDWDIYFMSNVYWEDVYTMTGVLSDHLAVCDGIAQTTKALCDELGIPCLYVSAMSSVGEGHAWNFIQMEDGNWYSFDGTNFACMVIDSDFSMEGFENGLKSGELMQGRIDSLKDPRHDGTTLLDLDMEIPQILSETSYVYNGDIRAFDHYDGTYDFDAGESVFLYEANPDGATCTIIGYEGPQSGDLVIPEKIDGLTVTSIGQAAFYRCKGFTGRLVIPDTVETIGTCAFFQCTELTGGIDLPEGLTFIDTSAFAFCSGFTGSISFPASVTNIGNSAFYRCENISGDLILPENLQFLGDFAFDYCYGLDGKLVIPDQAVLPSTSFIGETGICEIQLGENNPNYLSYDGILYTKDGKTALLCPPGKSGDFTILDTTEVIGDYAFAYCDKLTGELVLPDGLKRIGKRAFYEHALTCELVLPDGLEYIGESAFDFSFPGYETKRPGFTGDLVIPDSVTEIGDSAFSSNDFGGVLVLPKNITAIQKPFSYCRFSGQLVIPDSVERISEYAFSSDSDRPMFYEPQGELAFPSNLKSIGERAFSGYGMTGTLEIPASVSSIGDYAFVACTSLEAFDVDDGSDFFSACEGVLMSKDQSVLIAYPMGKEGASYTIPDTVTAIGAAAFFGCESLSAITVPDSVTSVGQEAFCLLAYDSEIYVPNEEIMRLVEAQTWADYTHVYSNRGDGPCELAAATIASITDQVSDGSPLEPPLVVTCMGTELVSGVDYVAEYYDNVEPGTAAVFVFGRGHYKGVASTTFRIVDSPEHVTVSMADVDIAPIPDVYYHGRDQIPRPEVTYKGRVLQEWTDYCIEYSDNVDPGVGTVTFRGMGGFSGSKTVTFNILPRSLAEADIAPIPGAIYTGFAHEPAVEIDCDGVILRAGKDYDLSYADNVEIGVATVTIIGKKGFTDSVSMTFDIVESPVKFDGTPYHIVSGIDDSLVLDVAKAVPEAGSNVAIWTSNGGLNQLFTFELAADGNIVLRNVANTILVLDAAGAFPGAGANVSTWTYNEGLNQEWMICPADDGSFTIVSAANPRLVLDAAGSAPAAGANVGLWVGNGNSNQLWKFADATDLADANVDATGMVRNVIEGKGAAPDITLSLYGTELVEGEDYELIFEGGASSDASTKGIDKAVPSAPGTYTVTAKALDGSGFTGEAEVGTYELYDVSDVAVAGLDYRIVSASDESFILDVAKAMPEAGSNVSVWTSNGGENQLFTIEASDDGYYILQNVANPDLVLDAAGAEPEIGANVSTWTANTGLNQRWVVIPAGEGTYNIASASNTDFILDAAGAEPEIGANVSLWVSNGGGLNQQWSFVRDSDLAYADATVVGMSRNYTGGILSPGIMVSLNGDELIQGEDYVVRFDDKEDAPSEPGSYAVTIVGVGDFSGTVELGEFNIYDVPEAQEGVSCHLVSGFSDQFVLDVAGAEPISGANVSIWTDNGGPNQLFTLELSENGYYALRNVANPDLVLDAAGVEPQAGANVSTWAYHEAQNQLWVLVPSDKMEGYYMIQSAANPAVVLDASGSAPEIGANVGVWISNGGPNQLWKPVPTE